MPVAAVDQEHRVTPRELFFDLVFVFAFTQVATLLADEPTFAGIGRGVLVLGALWWAWAAYAWLTNTVDPEDGVVGAALLVALIAMFVAALVVPDVFGDEGVLFGAAFLVVNAMNIALYALAGRGNRDLLGAVLRLAPWTLLGSGLILLAGFADGAARTWLWVAALAWTYVGGLLSGSTGWRRAPVALRGALRPRDDHRPGRGVHRNRDRRDRDGHRPGRGRRRGPRAARRHIVLARLLRLLRDPGRANLVEAQGEERVAFARDAYAYLHFPMIVGIVLFAFAMKTIVGHVGDELDSAAAFALCGGSALYLLTYSAIRIRVERRWHVSRGRFVAAILLLLLLPVATVVSGLAALALVTAVWLGLHAYELVRWRQARSESRSALASSF